MRTIALALLAFFQISTACAQPASGYRLLVLDDRPVKWGAQSLSAGARVTYAFVAEAMAFDDARNCRKLSPVDPLVARAGIDRAAFEAQAAAAAAMWERAANITLTRTEDVASADILIGVDAEARGSAHADVLPDPGEGLVGGIARGLVCLSANQAWKIGFGGDPSAQDIRYTLAHEIGHAIGLNHPSPRGQLMSFSYGEDFSELQHGDVDGAVALYGPPAAPSAAIASLPATPAP